MSAGTAIFDQLGFGLEFGLRFGFEKEMSAGTDDDGYAGKDNSVSELAYVKPSFKPYFNPSCNPSCSPSCNPSWNPSWNLLATTGNRLLAPLRRECDA